MCTMNEYVTIKEIAQAKGLKSTRSIRMEYKGVIIGHLINKTLRYNELQKLISHATPKMLIQQLKELETDGIIKRKLYPVVPPKTEYSLTKRGETLIPAIIELNKWGMNYLKEENIPCAYKGEMD